jgi:ABC-2 type transport system ATP-binding protein
MLDLIRPTSGRALLFGIESSADPVAIHRRVGYIPGEFTLYDRLSGAQHLEYFANLRGGVDPAYQAALVERLDLDAGRRFKEYSKGNKQKVGLVIALQHRPELLILDEPTSGLDPLVQQTFFTILGEAVAEGTTVFLSSHILNEVEKSCQRVAIIREGRLAKVDTVEALRDLAHHEVELRFVGDVPRAAFEALPGVSDVVVEDHVLKMRVFGAITPIVQAAAGYELLDFVSREPSLEDTFLAQYGEQAVGGR